MTRELSSKYLLAFAMCAFVTATLFFFIRRTPPSKPTAAEPTDEHMVNGDMKVWDGKNPSRPLLINEEGRTHPGDPEHAVQDLKKFYEVLIAFRAAHGRLPAPNEVEGQGPNLISKEDETTPDQKYADGMIADNSVYTWSYLENRPDGKPVPATPDPGARDVWIYTRIYARNNQTIYPDGRSTMSPSGVYVVLWSDGSVEKIPTEQMLMVRQNKGSYRLAFPGQAGIGSEQVPYATFENNPYNFLSKPGSGPKKSDDPKTS